MVCWRVAGASLREADRSFGQREPGVNFVENHDVVKKITLYHAMNQSQAQKALEFDIWHYVVAIKTQAFSEEDMIF